MSTDIRGFIARLSTDDQAQLVQSIVMQELLRNGCLHMHTVIDSQPHKNLDRQGGKYNMECYQRAMCQLAHEVQNDNYESNRVKTMPLTENADQSFASALSRKTLVRKSAEATAQAMKKSKLMKHLHLQPDSLRNLENVKRVAPVCRRPLENLDDYDPTSRVQAREAISRHHVYTNNKDKCDNDQEILNWMIDKSHTVKKSVWPDAIKNQLTSKTLNTGETQRDLEELRKRRDWLKVRKQALFNHSHSKAVSEATPTSLPASPLSSPSSSPKERTSLKEIKERSSSVTNFNFSGSKEALARKSLESTKSRKSFEEGLKIGSVTRKSFQSTGGRSSTVAGPTPTPSGSRANKKN